MLDLAVIVFKHAEGDLIGKRTAEGAVAGSLRAVR